MLLMLVTLSVR